MLHQKYSKNDKKITVNRNTRVLDNTYIYIKYNKSSDQNNYSDVLIKKFMDYMNGIIGAKTATNYHIEKVKNFTIRIPIYVYTNEEAKMNPIDLLEKRVKTIMNFLENFDWKTVSKFQLWLVRSLHILGINISTCFNIETEMPNVDYKKINETILIKFPDIQYPKLRRIKLNDNSMITLYSDPYMDDYGLFLNLSVSFDEMGMSYNALHLYEHLLTKPWDKLNGHDLIELNGSTYPVGTCFVYTIHKTINSLKLHMNSTLKWLLKSRLPDFWKNKEEEINLETIRTISETRRERTLTSMGRSDLHAYDLKYNTDIFDYWSNKPFNILLAGPDDFNEINEDKLNVLVKKYSLRNDIKRPENIKFKNIPMDVLKMKKFTGFYILKDDVENIKNRFLKNDFESNSFFGIDCVMSCKSEDLSVYNSVLHPLLYLNKYFTDEELNDYVKRHVIPFSSKLFSNASVQLKNAGNYLSNLIIE